jgi:hypothetical protein
MTGGEAPSGMWRRLCRRAVVPASWQQRAKPCIPYYDAIPWELD